MRECGYHLDKVTDKEELVFSRVIGSSQSGYPRFHVYVRVDKENQLAHFNLHLDQKAPIYKGTRAHGGEYEGELVEREVERIKSNLKL